MASFTCIVETNAFGIRDKRVLYITAPSRNEAASIIKNEDTKIISILEKKSKKILQTA
jgi:hypothetical protein